MVASDYGLNLIKIRESLTLVPIPDADGYAIGYGNNFYENGTPVSKNDSSIDKSRAESLFKNIISSFESSINKLIKKDLSQKQFDALISFSYNIGQNAFKNSTLLKKVNIDPDDPSIRTEFYRWNKSGDKVLPGLTKRRKEEADMYFSDVDEKDDGGGDKNDGGGDKNDGGGDGGDDSNDVISSDDGGGNNNNNNGNDSSSEEYKKNIGIENILKPTLKVEPIIFNSPSGEESSSVPIGKKPFLWFNNMQIDLVEKFRLSSSDFLPTISIVFQDSYGFFDNLRFANDDDRIKVFLDSKNDLIRPIFMEFKILSFKKIDDGIFELEGVMNVNRMLTTRIESYSNSTSFDVLKKVSGSCGLGFNTNVSNTNDSMTWVNPSYRGMEFCKEVIKKSYRGEKSFMWGFVDFFYNLNFIDVESQLKWDLSKQLGILTSDLTHIQNKLNLTEKDEVSMNYLSNDRSSHGSSQFFESYKIFNNSTRRSIEQGYATEIKYYDWKNKEILIFQTEAISSEKEDDLILKSEDMDFLKENTTSSWEGKMMTNNVHDNFHYTNMQNITNLNEVQKIGMEVVLPVCNYNLYKFMKIYVLLINQGLKEINPRFNKKLSGEWLIIDIQFFLELGELKQKIKLIRRELGFSQEEVADNK